MIRVLIIPFTYIMGYLISHFTEFEIKKHKSLFQKLFKTFSILTSLVIMYYSFNSSVIMLIVLTVSFLISLLFTKRGGLKTGEGLLMHLFLGVLVGYNPLNNIIILLTCALFYFKSSYDYLNNDELFNNFTNLFTFLIMVLISYSLNNNVLTIITSGLLIGLLC